MARKHFANAIMSRQNVPFDEWMEVLRNQNEGAVPRDHVHRIAKTVLRKCDPNQYLLSHATIVASVDTYEPKGVKTGRMMNRGIQIDVRYPDFRIKHDCLDLINNNNDGWNRSLLLSTYRTFVGAPNYCFLPDTKIQMADGTLSSIEDISVGDLVIGGSGQPKKVVHKHVRDYSGDIKLIYVGHRKNPICCTPNHPFAVMGNDDCKKCGVKLETGKRPSSLKQRIKRVFCTDCGRKSRDKANFGIDIKRVRSDDLKPRDVLFAPIPVLKVNDGVEPDVRFAKLVGLYLGDGCALRSKGKVDGISFHFGSNEKDLIQSAIDTIRAVAPGQMVSVQLSDVTDNCTIVKFYNTNLALAIVDVAGCLSYSKKLSTEFMNSIGPDEIKNLIGAYLSCDADMHCTTQRHRLCSVSLDLLQQIQYLGSCIGLNSFIVPSSIKIGDTNQVKFKDGTVHGITCKHEAYILHFDVASSQKLSTYSTKKQTRSVKSGDLKFFNDKRITFVNRVETDKYEGKVYNLEIEEDHSYIVDGTVQVFNCEHVQIPELSKGFVVDAIARDLGKSCYIDILVATDRKHDLLIKDILAGDMQAFSMGCISLFTICTKCGNVAADDTQLCSCIQYEGKGTEFIDELGEKQKIAELIGHVTVPNSNQFIEASWVKNPAFSGAVRRNFLNQNFIQTASKLQNASSVYEIRRDMPDLDGLKRAASIHRFADQAQSQGQVQDVPDIDLDEGQQAQGQSTQETPSKPGVSKDTIDGLLDKVQEQLLSIIVDRLDEKLKPKPEDVGVAIPASVDLTTGNDNIVRSSEDFSRHVRRRFANTPRLVEWAEKTYKIVHDGGIKSIRAAGIQSRDLIVLSWVIDSVKGKKYSSDLYHLSMKIGPSSNYPSEKSYLTACELDLGRSLTSKEKKFLTWKGRIASVANL